MNKILTISIAAYNVESYIKDTLDSITGTPLIDELEVFVIDDGGKDSTIDIANQYAERFPDSIKVIRKRNEGWGSTVNYSISHATGKYLKLLDGDDYYNKNSIDVVIELLRECESDVVCTPYVMFYDNNVNRTKTFSLPKDIICGKEYKLDDVADSMVWSMQGLAFKTNKLQDNKLSLLEFCYYTDFEYIAKALSNSSTITFFDEPLYFYRIGYEGRSCSKEGYNKHYAEHEKVLEELLKYKKQLSYSSKCLDRIVNKMVGNQYRVYLMLDSKDLSRKLFWDFDKGLKERTPELYSNANLGRVLRSCKKIPWGFELARAYYRNIRSR